MSVMFGISKINQNKFVGYSLSDKDKENPYAALLEFNRKLDQKQCLNPSPYPELSEKEIDAICKEAACEFWAENSDIYPPRQAHQ